MPRSVLSHRLACCGLLTLLLCLGANVALASNPVLNGISPPGAQRGLETEVTFTGGTLADAQEILFYYPGISVTQFEVQNDNAIKTKLNIAPDCRMGIHACRIRTATGISNLMTFHVSALPIVLEVEPNSNFDEPQSIPLDVTVHGVADYEDVDYYAVDAAQGDRITVEVEGIRLGRTFFDPYVAIMDSERFELASSDDAALVWQDGVASVVAPAAGKYIIQVRESAYQGNGACLYRAHIGKFPRPLAALPAGGRPGETLSVRLLGDVLGERVQEVTVPADAGRLFGIHAQDEFGLSPSALVFRVNDLPNALEAEPNADVATATPGTAPGAFHGVIGEPEDIDFFKFSAAQGQVFDIYVRARAIRSPLDPVLYVHRVSDGATLAGNDDSGNPDSYLRFQAPEAGEFAVSVRDHLGKGAPHYAYRVEVSPVVPKLTMGLPERQQYVDVTVSVPRGNRTAFLVSASRQDFGGELTVGIDQLPAGLSLETVTMAANETYVPVLLSAAADAPLAGALTDVQGRPVDSNLQVVGHLEQMTGLVRGQNNIMVWGHLADRMATAVTSEVPFTIEVVQPQVPIVRNGSMDLKIIAHRQEGFTAPIAVRMLYNPPGIGSSTSIAIPEGQNEVLLPLTANEGAEIRTFRCVIVAEAGLANGPVLVSSQMFNLDISEPFVTFAFNQAACEKGQETDLVVTVTKVKDYAGPAQVELLGLPFEVTSEALQMMPESAELVFHVKTTPNSPVGRHRTVLCRAVLTLNGEPIVHTLGTGEIRIDEPLPPKPMETAVAEPAPMPMPEAPPMPMERRLTRLEQLRLDRERARQASGGQAPPAPEQPQQ